MFDISPSMTLYKDCGYTHLVTVLSCISMACWLHFLSCPEKLAVLFCLSIRTPPPERPSTLTNCKQASHKHNQPVFNRRVSNISAEQAGNTYRQPVKNMKPTRQLHNRQVGNCVGQASFIFTTHGLSADEISVYI